MQGFGVGTFEPFDVDGLKNLTVNFNDMSWSWERITTDNCMPDSELAKYQTKAFIARDGSMKVWMTEFVHWDGGDIMPKLGSSMVATATGTGAAGTGGYDKSAFPSSWNDSKLNMDFENTEIGGKLEGTNEHGRIYAFSEIITGTPTAGIGFARNEVVPDAWKAGNKITDAVGDEYVIEYINNKTAGTFTGDNAADEAKHPTLKMQCRRRAMQMLSGKQAAKMLTEPRLKGIVPSSTTLICSLQIFLFS